MLMFRSLTIDFTVSVARTLRKEIHMAIVRLKRKSGEDCYLVRVRDSMGGWFPGQTFDRIVDAKVHERTLLLQRDRGTVRKRECELAFGEFWNAWSAQCRSRVSEGWRISQDQMVRDYLLPNLSGMTLSAIRPMHVSSLLGNLSEKLAPQTVLHVYNLLHKMFGDAVEVMELLERSPVLRKERPRVPIRERAFLVPKEAVMLLEASRSHFLGPAIWLGLLSGLRPSEIQALKWDCVDLEGRRILIRAAFKRKVNRLEPFPKQSDWGSAPIPDGLASYLAGLPRTSEFVAPGLKGGMLEYNTFMKGLRRLCHSVEVTSITPHELRHSCTELYVQAGASAEDIRRLLNQSSLSATQRYMHRTDERLGRIADQIFRTLSVHSSAENGLATEQKTLPFALNPL